MKINIEVDCTPEEARKLFGLPDLEPVHEIYLSRVKELMAKGITPDLVEGMVKSWAPMGEAGLGLVQNLMGQFGGAILRGGGGKGSDGDKPAAPRGGKG